MKKRNIYGGHSQELRELYEEAGQASKVVVGAIDYAKGEHVVLLCNGEGDVLRKPFAVKNTPEGLEYLRQQIEQACCYRHINPKHVYFGGEDGGGYTENFIAALRACGWLVAGINPQDAKQQRTNLQASTDRLDLFGIASMLVQRRGQYAPAQVGHYRNLRTLVRHRRASVRLHTQERQRMHTLVDRLFPGFLDEQLSGLTPFAPPSLKLMERRFSATQVARCHAKSLALRLARVGATHAEEKAAKLQTYARQVFPPADEYRDTWQISLQQHVELFRCLEGSLNGLEREIAVWLAQTAGAWLTTVRGIGVVLAAGVAAEIGDPQLQRPVSNLSSYAGIIPRVSQTGGPSQPAFTGSVAKRCNRILKDYIVQSASHLGLHGAEELMQDYHRRDAAGQHADFGIARRYLRLGMALMRRGEIYLPRALRKSSATAEQRAAYYQKLWPYLFDKWAKYQAHKVAFAPENPLGQWRAMVQELYGLKLSL
jgi:transposase